jgi:hypothetical protein
MWAYIWGALSLIVGFFLVVFGTTGWKPWRRPDTRQIRAILFAAVIGLGGLSTTWGWNRFSSLAQERSDEQFRKKFDETNREFRTGLESTNREFRHDLDQREQKLKTAQEERDLREREARKNAVILAVAREWKWNELARTRNPFAQYDRGDMDTVRPGRFFVFVRFDNSQVKLASNSAVFDWTSAADLLFVVCMLNYATAIDQLNMLCDTLNIRTMIGLKRPSEDPNSYRKRLS